MANGRQKQVFVSNVGRGNNNCNNDLAFHMLNNRNFVNVQGV
jgi:hypothetical protein